VNFLASGIINVLSDILILILPLWTIWHLKMPIQKKLSVSAAFAAGILYESQLILSKKYPLIAPSANFAGIMRLDFSVQIINSTNLTLLRLQHGMWTYASSSHASSIPFTNIGFARIAEITTAIICASLPLIPKFLSLLRQQYSRFASSASKPQGRISSRSGLRAPPFSSEPFVWPDVVKSGVSASRNKEQVTVTATYVPTDEELALVSLDASGKALKDGQGPWYETMKGKEGIRKTVRIEQIS
jgi:hypothetical protein